jgi:hypothetical protein
MPRGLILRQHLRACASSRDPVVDKRLGSTAERRCDLILIRPNSVDLLAYAHRMRGLVGYAVVVIGNS